MSHEMIGHPASRQLDRQIGFTLLEVMIAMFILTVGLLALAGVQISGIKATSQAYARSQASIAAEEMADRMRANIAGVNAGDYAAIASPPAASPGPATCRGAGVTCSAAQIAARDAYEWLTSLSSLDERNMPRATGSVTCSVSPCVAGSLHEITIRWDGRHNGATGTGCNPNNSNDLICYKVTFQP